MNENVVIIPTFNEKENITITIDKISILKTKFDIIVVDDNSPDKTGEIVKKIIESKKYNFNIYLLERRNLTKSNFKKQNRCSYWIKIHKRNYCC